MAKSVLRRYPSGALSPDDQEQDDEGLAFIADRRGMNVRSIVDGFFEYVPSGSYSGVLRRWTGGAWSKAKLSAFSGGSFAGKKLMRWTAAGWVEVDATGV